MIHITARLRSACEGCVRCASRTETAEGFPRCVSYTVCATWGKEQYKLQSTLLRLAAATGYCDRLAAAGCCGRWMMAGRGWRSAAEGL